MEGQNFTINSMAAVERWLTEDEHGCLTMLAANRRDQNWSIGDVTNGIKDRRNRERVEVTDQMIYRVVGKVVGLGWQRVEDYSRLAAFYENKEVRDKYEVLPFSHFEYAARFPDRWESVLDLAVRGMDQNMGRVPSLEWLRAYFVPMEGDVNPQGIPPDPESQGFQDPEDFIQEGELLDEDQPAIDGEGPITGAEGAAVVGYMDRSVDYLAQSIYRLPLDQDTKDRFYDVLNELKELIEVIRQVIEQE